MNKDQMFYTTIPAMTREQIAEGINAHSNANEQDGPYLDGKELPVLNNQVAPDDSFLTDDLCQGFVDSLMSKAIEADPEGAADYLDDLIRKYNAS